MATNTTPMEVFYADGTTRRVCCGPAALADAAKVGYRPLYDEAVPDGRAVCCHTGAVARAAKLADERAAHDTDAVRDALRNHPPRRI